MPRNGSADQSTLNDIAAQIIADNPEIRSRVEGMFNSLLDIAEHTIKFGTPSDRVALMKTMVPSMMRSMQAASQTGAERERQAAYERLKESMRGGT